MAARGFAIETVARSPGHRFGYPPTNVSQVSSLRRAVRSFVHAVTPWTLAIQITQILRNSQRTSPEPPRQSVNSAAKLHHLDPTPQAKRRTHEHNAEMVVESQCLFSATPGVGLDTTKASVSVGWPSPSGWDGAAVKMPLSKTSQAESALARQQCSYNNTNRKRPTRPAIPSIFQSILSAAPIQPARLDHPSKRNVFFGRPWGFVVGERWL